MENSDIVSSSEASGLSEDEFYSALISRNKSLISSSDQLVLRYSRFAILGCGSTGGGVIEPLVRSGASKFVLADPGIYDLGNLNRQQAFVVDLGRNKASVHRERILGVNPHSEVKVFEDGVLFENAREIVKNVDLILDAVDVTSKSGLIAKREVHNIAKEIGIPVVCAYDIAGTQYVTFIDYRLTDTKLLIGEGEVSLKDLVPPSVVPVEMYEDLIFRKNNPDAPFPQLGMTSALLGAIFPQLAIEILAGRDVKKGIVIDLNRIVRTKRRNIMTRVRQVFLLPKVLKAVGK